MSQASTRPDPWSAVLGSAALAGVIVFACVCLAAQFLRTDLRWTRAPLSFYLVGPGGHVVQAAYLVLAAGLAALGAGMYRNLPPFARSAAPLVLFVVAGVALAVTALAKTNLPGMPVHLHGFVHLLAAATTFICVTTAMLLQSWRMRLDPAWRCMFLAASLLAASAFVDLGTYALLDFLPRGLMQKGVIALILLWLGGVSWRLAKTARHAAD